MANLFQKCKLKVCITQILRFTLLTKQWCTSIITITSPTGTHLLRQPCSGRTARPCSSLLTVDRRNDNA